MVKVFLFHLKKLFSLLKFLNFVLYFCSFRKNGLIRNIILILKLTSQPDQQTITIHILSNISRRKDNQTMKFVQLIEYCKINIFFKNYEENEARRLVLDLFLFYKIVFQLCIRSKQVVCSLACIYSDSPQPGIQ